MWRSERGEVSARAKCGGVDRDGETAMFGERTEESNANLYPGNWKQHSSAPETHSGAQWPVLELEQRGRVMRARGMEGWMEG